MRQTLLTERAVIRPEANTKSFHLGSYVPVIAISHSSEIFREGGSARTRRSENRQQRARSNLNLRRFCKIAGTTIAPRRAHADSLVEVLVSSREPRGHSSCLQAERAVDRQPEQHRAEHEGAH